MGRGAVFQLLMICPNLPQNPNSLCLVGGEVGGWFMVVVVMWPAGGGKGGGTVSNF